MVPLLKKDIQFVPREEEGLVVLCRELPNGSKAEIRIHPIQAFIMVLFDGQNDKSKVAQVIAEVMSIEPQAAVDIVETLLNRFSLFFTDTPLSDTSLLSHNPEDFLFEGDDTLIVNRREDAPGAIVWVVTEDCNRKCKYCYKDAKFVADGFARDIAFPFERVTQVIDEAAMIGVNRLIFTGGEPLLRQDLPEVIGHTIDQNIIPIVITKMRVEGDMMARLVKAGLEELHVSLDSVVEAEVEKLVGVEGALDDMLVTINACCENGIKVVLRPVMTAINVDNLEQLISQTYAMGVREFVIDVYGKTCGRHEPSFMLSDEQEAQLKVTVKSLKERYTQAKFGFNFDLREATETKGCMEGLKGITVQPNGLCVKCEHIPPGPHNTFGDLNESGLLDIWISEKMKEIVIPSRKFFKGTSCYKCDLFRNCNYVRGRCTVTAKGKFGTIHAPDLYCPIGEFHKSNEIDVHVINA
ncbi:radical SAM protein [Pseudoalteromonas sp. J010]|uniref:radical SAM/SPASM domain-containing protein n=1 Tax=Pseudoalteromonas sp. J010 TaxID=998465 RepID=UPI000F6557D3|nr:radical SAM protein [Pseudoalteromonas sp. J010]RRS09900.1 radical SAM protein [Pseudoalteromonas sp. J010]